MNLLDRAQRLLQGRSSSRPKTTERYRVLCPGGNQLHGNRTESPQVVRCPNCTCNQVGVFVLPISPLPEPPALAPSKPKRTPRTLADAAPAYPEISYPDEVRAAEHADEPNGSDASASLNADLEVPWEDDLHAETNPDADGPTSMSDPQGSSRALAGQRPPRPGSPKARPQPGAPADGRPVPPTRRPRPAPASASIPIPAEEPETESVGGADLLETLARYRMPLTVLFVMALVGVTVYLVMLRSRYQEYPRIIERAETEGIAALTEGKFDLANRLLSEALPALDALRDYNPEVAGEVRQAAAESALIVDLLGPSIEDLVEEAARYRPPEDWPDYFDAVYGGRAIVVESEVLPGLGASGSSTLGYRILTGVGPTPDRTARFDLDGLEILSQPLAEDGRVIFAARLESVDLDDRTGQWVVRFLPDSGVWMTRYEVLVRLGWPRPDEDPSREQFDLEAATEPQFGIPDPGLLGRTRLQIRSETGIPDQVRRLSSQGLSIEQWYYGGRRSAGQYINFETRPGFGEPVVISHFTNVPAL